MMDVKQLSKIENYISKHARAVDLARYEFHFRGGGSSPVLKALAAYQNEDGGFGNALEPDLRADCSTAIATCTAFGSLNELNLNSANGVLQRALKYIIDTYDEEQLGWPIVQPEIDAHPHAPWWTYEVAMKHFGWGNPSAELLGALINYNDLVDAKAIIGSMASRAIERIHQIDPSSFHEVMNFKALFQLGDDELKAKLENPLRVLIKEAANTSPSDWGSYVATPLKFVSSPDDLFIHLFDHDTIQKNLDFLLDGIIDGDHWEPNWDWAGNYPEAWETAKQEWCGHLTVINLMTLKNFGAI